LVKQVAFRKVILELCAAGKNEASDIGFCISNEEIRHLFGDTTDVIMSFFLAETRETEGRLSSSAVFFGEIDAEFVDYFTGVAR